MKVLKTVILGQTVQVRENTKNATWLGIMVRQWRWIYPPKSVVIIFYKMTSSSFKVRSHLICLTNIKSKSIFVFQCRVITVLSLDVNVHFYTISVDLKWPLWSSHITWSFVIIHGISFGHDVWTYKCINWLKLWYISIDLFENIWFVCRTF